MHCGSRLAREGVRAGNPVADGTTFAGKPAPTEDITGTAGSVLTAGHFEQVVAELGLDRALHGVDRGAEDDGVEFLDHLAWAEGAQVAALAAGWASGVGLGDFGEVGTSFDLCFEFVALLEAADRMWRAVARAMGYYSLGEKQA